MARLLVLSDNHAVQDLNSIVSESVVMTETQVHDMANQRVQIYLVALVRYKDDKGGIFKGRRTPQRAIESSGSAVFALSARAFHNLSIMVAPSPRIFPARRQTARCF